jgi:hypothetical protein
MIHLLEVDFTASPIEFDPVGEIDRVQKNDGPWDLQLTPTRLVYKEGRKLCIWDFWSDKFIKLTTPEKVSKVRGVVCYIYLC